MNLFDQLTRISFSLCVVASAACTANENLGDPGTDSGTKSDSSSVNSHQDAGHAADGGGVTSPDTGRPELRDTGTSPKDAPAASCHGSSDCPTGSCCNGVCVDLASDMNNCGFCGAMCTSGAACTVQGCSTSCAADSCPAGTTCGAVYGPFTTTACLSSTCPQGWIEDQQVAACSAGAGNLGLCCWSPGESTTCMNLTSDPNNCGTCGWTCTGGESCVQGNCVPGGVSFDAGAPADAGKPTPDGGAAGDTITINSVTAPLYDGEIFSLPNGYVVSAQTLMTGNDAMEQISVTIPGLAVGNYSCSDEGGVSHTAVQLLQYNTMNAPTYHSGTSCQVSVTSTCSSGGFITVAVVSTTLYSEFATAVVGATLTAQCGTIDAGT